MKEILKKFNSISKDKIEFNKNCLNSEDNFSKIIDCDITILSRKIPCRNSKQEYFEENL